MLVFSMLCMSGIAMAQSGSIDTSASDRLTKYLHKNRLPMVGAQVSNTSSGRQLMLFGYVATDFGKADAVGKSTRFLHEPNIRVVNNIQVDPQVQHLKKHKASNGSGAQMGASNPPPRSDWENTFDSTLRSGGAMPSNDPSLNMPPPSGPAPAPPGSSW